MSQDRMLQGKVVVVTGAGGGIGREIALLMAKNGAQVVVNDIGSSVHGEGVSTSVAENVVQEIKANGGEAVASVESVADWDAAHRVIDTAVQTFGHIDCVVNNAAILRDVIFHKMSREDWDASIQVVLNGSFYMSRAAAPHFRQQESGSYIHISSSSGLIGNVGQANYGTGKIGLVGLSKCIALDMRRFNVRSNVVAPTAFTRMSESVPTTNPEAAERLRTRERIPAEKNAPLIVFLASDAAREVNGQVFYSRKNELILSSQMRPLTRIHSSDGWTPQSIAEHMLPAFRHAFIPLERTREVLPTLLP